MYRLFLISLLLIFAVSAGYAADYPDNFREGKVAVRVTVDSVANDEFGILSDTRHCIENHLDYFLWSKGWSFEIQDTAIADNIYPAAETDGADYDYILDITARPEIIPTRDRNSDARKHDYFVNYPLFKSLTFSAVLKTRTNPDSILFAGNTKIARRDNWLGIPNMYDVRESPEPPDNMIKRAISATLDGLPDFPRKIILPKNEISVYLVLDEAYRETGHEHAQLIIEEAIEYASQAFYRQFGYGLKVQGVSYMQLPGATLESMNKNHLAVIHKVQPAMNCLIAAVYLPRDGFNYYNRGRSFHVGLSNIGRRHMITAQIPAPDSSLAEWETFINGLLILHETGHLMGGIHVSDINSIMYHESPWLSSWSFDNLNRDIIARALEDDTPLKKIDSYLELVMASLERTGYNRADFGQFLWEFARVNPRFEWPDNLFDSDIRRSAAYLLDGVTACRKGDNETARTALYKALALTPNQGAIQYWLSKTTDGELAKKHLIDAARLGFSDAVLDLMWKE